MTLALDDTVAALASAPGAAARGIVRISGPDVRDVLDRLIVSTSSAQREPRPPGLFPRRFQGKFFSRMSARPFPWM